jgi:hypothetical protein
MARKRKSKKNASTSRGGNPAARVPIPASPTLPGSLAQQLHDIGARRRPMPTDSSAIRHHYIAQMLLREFLDPTQPRDRLWQLDKTNGRIDPQTTEGAASVRRLYRVAHTDGGESDHLEAFFSMVEDHAADSFRRLRATPGVLDEGDRANISLLLALQDQRTPAGQARALAQIEAGARLWLATQLADAHRSNRRYLRDHPGATSADAEAARLKAIAELQDGTIGVEAPKETVLQHMLQSWLQIAGELHGLRWKLLWAREAEFVIGDRPMVMHDPTPRFPFSGNGIHSSPTAYTLMPLGPDLCLRMDHHGDHLCERTVTRQANLINLRSYGWAQRFVYARGRHVLEELHEHAQAHPEEAPGPRPDPQVICEDADPDDPSVGAEHPPGYPKGIWYSPPGEEPKFMAYTLQYMDDPRTVGIDETYFSSPP